MSTQMYRAFLRHGQGGGPKVLGTRPCVGRGSAPKQFFEVTFRAQGGGPCQIWWGSKSKQTDRQTPHLYIEIFNKINCMLVNPLKEKNYKFFVEFLIIFLNMIKFKFMI